MVKVSKLNKRFQIKRDKLREERNNLFSLINKEFKIKRNLLREKHKEGLKKYIVCVPIRINPSLIKQLKSIKQEHHFTSYNSSVQYLLDNVILEEDD